MEVVHEIISRVLSNILYKFSSAFCLLLALFGGYIWILCDFEDDPSNAVLDILMITITVFFFLEIILCCIGQKGYPCSFFFFMDVLGTLSMAFEISSLLGSAGEMNSDGTSVDAVLMRTARAAKLAARAGRLMKLTKLMTLCYAHEEDEDEAKESKHSMQADKISKKLTHALSTKVSMLTIVLVLCLPLFGIGTYPETDMSMEMWARKLETNYGTAARANARKRAEAQLNGLPIPSNSTLEFLTQLRRFKDFYVDKNYAPYKIQGFPEHVVVDGMPVYIPGEETFREQAPNRKQNIMHVTLDRCELQRPGCKDVALFFDFNEPGQLNAALESAMLVFVIAVMALVSYNVSYTVDNMVVVPIGKALTTLRTNASSFLEGFVDKEGSGDDDADDKLNMEGMDEIDLLETIFKRLAKMTGIITEKNAFTAEEEAAMNQEEKGIVHDMMGCESLGKEYVSEEDMALDDLYPDIVENMDVETHMVDTFSLDFLYYSDVLRNDTALYTLFDTRVGKNSVRKHCDAETFRRFFETALDGYTNQPYHNATHAIDVTHTTFRLLTESRCDQWLSSTEQYALLVAALCHDLGHEGKTNQFLVETRHELAITFNDASPLENMHASTLFKISQQDGKAIFQKLSGDEYKTARKVCISTILHTDLAKHFEMVKELQQLYHVNSDIIESQCEKGSAALLGNGALSKEYVAEVFSSNCMRIMDAFLHLADVSNPLKPFSICKAWAWLVLDEFFAQGDEEKKLGIPVGMLNDRDHVNRPGSQHGFITFLVAPLVFGVVDLLPQLRQLSTNMATNLEEWMQLWIVDAEPDAEAIAKKREVVAKTLDDSVLRFQRLDVGRRAHLRGPAGPAPLVAVGRLSHAPVAIVNSSLGRASIGGTPFAPRASAMGGQTSPTGKDDTHVRTLRTTSRVTASWALSRQKSPSTNP